MGAQKRTAVDSGGPVETVGHSLQSTTEGENAQAASLLNAALAYARRGWYVFPCNPKGKEPVATGGRHANGKLKRLQWDRAASNDPNAVRALWAKWGTDCNIGLHLGKSGLLAVDVDPRNGGDETWHDLKTEHEIDDNTLTGLTGGGGTHLVYSVDGADPSTLKASPGAGVDIKRGNAYIVLPPSIHPDGPPYEWEVSGHPDDMAPLPLPPSLRLLLEKPVPSKGGNGKATLKTFSRGDDVAAAAKHLERLAPSRCDEYQPWVEVGMALSELGPTGLAMWQDWSRGSAKFEAGDCEEKWDTFKPGAGVTLASLHHWANEDSPQVATKRPAVEAEPGKGKPAAEPARTEGKRKPLKRLTSREYHALYKKWGYTFRLNLCNDDVEVDGEPLSDTHTASIRQRIRDYGIENHRGVSVGATDDCIVTQAVASCYHPVKDYFEALQWDGDDHLARLLSHITGDGYLDRWLDTWLPGAVARVYDGHQNPMLVLVGPQGVGKSYLAQWLCGALPRLFVESPICPEYKDHRLRLIQSFIWEVQELGATTRKADQDALKAFITLQWVKERKAYGKREMQKPAICSFIGTVNPDSGFLTDLTGNRRYIITGIESIDWGYSEAVDIDQLWAQAVHVYRNGEVWKLTGAEQAQSEQQNEKHLVVKPVQVFLERMYIVTDDDNDFVPVAEVLSRLDTEAGIKPNTGTAREVASVLRSWGAVDSRVYNKRGVRERGYKKLKPLTSELKMGQ